LGLEIKHAPKIHKLLDELSSLDAKDIEFKFQFENDAEPTCFKSHRELDQTLYTKVLLLTPKLNKQDAAKKLTEEDYRLLKAFDRGTNKIVGSLIVSLLAEVSRC
jgi:hypothetical protein